MPLNKKTVEEYAGRRALAFMVKRSICEFILNKIYLKTTAPTVISDDIVLDLDNASASTLQTPCGEET